MSIKSNTIMTIGYGYSEDQDLVLVYAPNVEPFVTEKHAVNACLEAMGYKIED